MRGDTRRCQAENPLIVLSSFPEPALTFPILTLRTLGQQGFRSDQRSRHREGPLWVESSHPQVFSNRGSDCAQLLSVRSGNSSRTFSGTLHPSPFAFSTSLLCTRLKSLNALSLRAVVIGTLLRCSLQRRNRMSARPVFCTRRNTIMVSST